MFPICRDNEEKDLSRLLDLLNTPASKQQVNYSLDCTLLLWKSLVCGS